MKTTTIRLVDDFIYGDTLNALYNLPGAWLRQGDLGFETIKNPYNKRKISRLYYRPEVEALILSRRATYTAQLHRRMARFTNVRGQLYWQALDQIKTIQIRLISPPSSLDQMRKELDQHMKIDQRLGPRPADWQPNLTDLFTFFRTTYTDYIVQINTFRNVPGAGHIWLQLRQQTDRLVMDAMIKLMDLEYSQKLEVMP